MLTSGFRNTRALVNLDLPYQGVLLHHAVDIGSSGRPGNESLLWFRTQEINVSRMFPCSLELRAEKGSRTSLLLLTQHKHISSVNKSTPIECFEAQTLWISWQQFFLFFFFFSLTEYFYYFTKHISYIFSSFNLSYIQFLLSFFFRHLSFSIFVSFFLLSLFFIWFLAHFLHLLFHTVSPLWQPPSLRCTNSSCQRCGCHDNCWVTLHPVCSLPLMSSSYAAWTSTIQARISVQIITATCWYMFFFLRSWAAISLMGNVPTTMKHCLSYEQVIEEYPWFRSWLQEEKVGIIFPVFLFFS